jgi:hypothetical protein
MFQETFLDELAVAARLRRGRMELINVAIYQVGVPSIAGAVGVPSSMCGGCAV